MNISLAQSTGQTFVPVLTIKRDIHDLASILSVGIEKGEDDLDSYDIAFVHLDTNVFCLVHYRGTGKGMTEVGIPPKLPDYHLFVEQVIHALRIDKADVILREVNYSHYQ